jgi:lipopolysaccharide cholinephosphotransferase
MNKMKLMSLKDLSPEELRKWQLKLLDILVYFRDFCQAHDLRFFLAAGTCIGAVRHHGFIPWDDDLDVQMPRKDFEKLLELWPKEADTSKFVCERTDKDKCIKFPMAVARSMDTTCIFDHSVNSDICQGLKIDVEFLDGYPDRKFERLVYKICANFVGLLRAERIPNRKSGLIKFASGVILGIFPTHSIRWRVSNFFESYLKKFDFDGDYQYVRYLDTPIRKRSSYSEAVYVDFEGYKMPIPSGYDQYLRDQYGDYMQLPPEDKRKPITDNLVFYDLDHSYQDYKGKYYCVKQ